MMERAIPVSIHGRYLVEPARDPAAPLLVGFHGYAEAAETQLDRMRAIPGADAWLLVAVQGLHRFYRGRTRDVVASWMTRQDRLRAIDDNLRFVAAVVEAVRREWNAGPVTVFSGFSQGVAMAFRAACAAGAHAAAVIVCGGDIPPEIDAAALAAVQRALIGRGLTDDWYTAEKLASDEARLRAAGVRVQAVAFDAAHEWPHQFSEAAGEFLAAVRGSAGGPATSHPGVIGSG